MKPKDLELVLVDKDSGAFFTGYSWSPEYPDAMEMTYAYAKKVAKGLPGNRRLVAIENYGYEDEREHEI